jgi:hypothetical protein
VVQQTMTNNTHQWQCGHRGGHFLQGSNALTDNEGAPIPPAAKWDTPRPPPEPPPVTTPTQIDIACCVWADTAQQSSQYSQAPGPTARCTSTPSLSNNTIVSTAFLSPTPPTCKGVPCAPFPTTPTSSSTTKEMPSASSPSHHHQ